MLFSVRHRTEKQGYTVTSLNILKFDKDERVYLCLCSYEIKITAPSQSIYTYH